MTFFQMDDVGEADEDNQKGDLECNEDVNKDEEEEQTKSDAVQRVSHHKLYFLITYRQFVLSFCTINKFK